MKSMVRSWIAAGFLPNPARLGWRQEREPGLTAFKRTVKTWLDEGLLPGQAKEIGIQDRLGLRRSDPGSQRIVEAGIAWLSRAQDESRSHDGGVARHFSLVDGWSTSYPETTGYIIPTMIDYGTKTGSKEPVDRARRMLDWLVSIQFPEGGFQGGMVHETPRVPVSSGWWPAPSSTSAIANRCGVPPTGW
jgi:hypothetical protein